MSENPILEYIQSLRASDLLGSQVTAYDYQAPRLGETCDFPEDLLPSVKHIFSQLGINRLYSHQLDAIDAVGRGEHVVISTPTASGKSLIYNLSFFKHFSQNPTSRSFYIFTLKALTQDQLKGFNDGARLMDHGVPTAAVYDGDTSAYQRRKIRKSLPNVLMTNPEMLHLAFLPHFDLETQRSAQEVGGWHMAHHMMVSCGVVYDSGTDTYDVYLEDQVDMLIEHLKRFDAVVGFNSKRFDYKVLSGYRDFNFATLPSIDLLELVHRQLGFRLSLDQLAEQTLGLNKSGSGLDALEWWKQGEIHKIIDYCKKDVRITLDLFLHLRNKGYLIYRQKDGEQFRVPIHLSY